MKTNQTTNTVVEPNTVEPTTVVIAGIEMTDAVIKHLSNVSNMSEKGIRDFMIIHEVGAVGELLRQFPFDYLKAELEEKLKDVCSLSGRSFRISFDGEGILAVNEILASIKSGGKSPQQKSYSFTAGLWEFEESKKPFTLEILTNPEMKFIIWDGHIVSKPDIKRTIITYGKSPTGVTEALLRYLAGDSKTQKEKDAIHKSGYVQFKDCPLISLK